MRGTSRRRRLPALATVLLLALGPAGAQPVRAQADLDAAVREARGSGCRRGLDALAAMAAGAGLEARRASYLLGWCHLRIRRPSDAAAAFGAAAGHPTLRLDARLGEAEALMRTGDAGGAASAAREIAASAGARLQGRAFLILGEAELRRGHPAQAAAAAAAAANMRPSDPAAWMLLGRTAAAAGQRDRARRAYARAAWAFPNDPAARPAREALGRLLGRPPAAADIDAQSRLLRGVRLAQQGEWEAAQVEFRAAAAGAGSGPVAGEAWYRLGELLLRSDIRGAHEAFRKAAAQGWDPAGAWFWTASTARRLGLAAQAREAVAALERLAPRDVWTARYWLGAGLRAEAAGRSADAAAFYRRAIAASPTAGDATEARWRLGWVALRAGRPADAQARFREAAGASPWRGEAARAWYWAARALEAAGGAEREAEAQQVIRLVADRYPMTFYGQRARTRLGLPPPDLPPALPRARPRQVAVPVHEELARLGFDAEATEAAEETLAGRPDPRLARFLAEAYARLGDYTRSVHHAVEALDGGVRDVATWRLAYPQAYWDEATAAAQAAGIDPLLLLALVREESRYDPAVLSPARAVGLAQLLPSTARAVAADPSLTVDQLKDPATNLRLGARYLKQQLDRFGGDLRLALAAYNAGPGAARRWTDLDDDPDYFTEKVPFAETRGYLRRVLGSYGIYRTLW